MLASPITLIILGIIAAAAILYTAWDQNFMGLKDITDKVVGFITDKFMWLVDKIGGVVSAVKGFFGQDIPESLEGATDAVANNGLVDAFQESLGGLAGTVGDLFGGIKDKVVEWAFPTGQEAGEQLGAGLHSMTETAFSDVEDGIEAVQENVVDRFKTMGDIAEETARRITAAFSDKGHEVTGISSTSIGPGGSFFQGKTGQGLFDAVAAENARIQGVKDKAAMRAANPGMTDLAASGLMGGSGSTTTGTSTVNNVVINMSDATFDAYDREDKLEELADRLSAALGSTAISNEATRSN